MPRLLVTLDDDVESPIPDGQIFAFSRKFKNFKHPENFGLYQDEDGLTTSRNIGIRRRLDCETAFILSYHEHGDGIWSLGGSGPQCRFDTAGVAGILFVDSRIPKDRRRAYAVDALKDYTDWCNGHVYFLSMEEDGLPVSVRTEVWGHCLDNEIAAALTERGLDEDTTEIVKEY
jgi:hypothetical protein